MFLWSRFQNPLRLKIRLRASQPKAPRTFRHRAPLLLLLVPRMACPCLGMVA